MLTARGKVISGVVGLAAFLACLAGMTVEARSQAGQSLRVFSEPESHCTLVRDGQVIYKLAIGKKYESALGLGIASLNYSSHGDVIVTCRHDGFNDASRTLVFGEMWMTVAAQPCYPSRNATEEEQEAICKDYQATRQDHGKSTFHGYPLHVVVPLEPLGHSN